MAFEARSAIDSTTRCLGQCVTLEGAKLGPAELNSESCSENARSAPRGLRKPPCVSELFQMRVVDGRFGEGCYANNAPAEWTNPKHDGAEVSVQCPLTDAPSMVIKCSPALSCIDSPPSHPPLPLLSVLSSVLSSFSGLSLLVGSGLPGRPT